MRSCDPQELELPALFYIYFNTHGVLLRVRVGARGLLFTRFNILFFLWRGMIGQSNAVYPDRLTPALV